MSTNNDFATKREKELAEDAIVLEKAIKNFWEILPIPVCTTSPVFIVLETGKGFDNLFGYAENELVGESLKEIAFDKESFGKILGQLAQQRKISNVEAVLQNKKGEKISVFISAIAQEDEQGEVFSYLFSFIDVTFIKKTERELQEKIKDSVRNAQELTQSKQALMNILEDIEEERKKAETERDKTLAIIKNFADGLLMIELDAITLFNPKAEEFFGITEKEVVNKKLLALSKQHVLFKALFDLIQAKGAKGIFREELIANDNFVIEVSVVCVKPANRCLAQIVILHDISREKAVERLKTEFVSIAAHQLRTPLSAIKWILRMFLDGDMGQISETQTQFLQKTYDSNERMINLVNDLLNVTRIEEGKFLQKIQKQDISTLLKEAAEPFQEKIKEKGLVFDFVLPDKELPKADVDKEKIVLAVQNLLENAVNYTKTGKIVLAAQYKPPQKEFQIYIQDTGIGIPEDQKKRVFSRFFRSTSALKTETEGTGLGLFIAKNIVEAHGGRIWFESEEGKGTTFYLTLPLLSKK